MDIRDFVQAVVGAVVLKPVQLVVSSVSQSSYVLQTLGARFPDYASFVTGFSLLDTFALVAGLGLVIGIGMSSSVFIALVVVLGLAGGFFAVDAVFTTLGINLNNLANGLPGGFGAQYTRFPLGDIYVLLPFLVLALGVFNNRRGAERKRKKAAADTQASLRHYCSFCGSVMEPGQKKCASCGKAHPKPAEDHCTSCGKTVGMGAKYCWVCGEEQLRIGPQKCQKCGTSMGVGAKFCPRCGTRQPTANLSDPSKTADSGTGP